VDKRKKKVLRRDVKREEDEDEKENIDDLFGWVMMEKYLLITVIDMEWYDINKV